MTALRFLPGVHTDCPVCCAASVYHQGYESACLSRRASSPFCHGQAHLTGAKDANDPLASRQHTSEDAAWSLWPPTDLPAVLGLSRHPHSVDPACQKRFRPSPANHLTLMTGGDSPTNADDQGHEKLARNSNGRHGNPIPPRPHGMGMPQGLQSWQFTAGAESLVPGKRATMLRVLKRLGEPLLTCAAAHAGLPVSLQ